MISSKAKRVPSLHSGGDMNNRNNHIISDCTSNFGGYIHFIYVDRHFGNAS